MDIRGAPQLVRGMSCRATPALPPYAMCLVSYAPAGEVGEEESCVAVDLEVGGCLSPPREQPLPGIAARSSSRATYPLEKERNRVRRLAWTCNVGVGHWAMACIEHF